MDKNNESSRDVDFYLNSAAKPTEKGGDETQLTSLSQIKGYLEKGTPPNTRKSYQYDWNHFCDNGGELPASPEAVANYLVRFATTLNPRTLRRRLSAIGAWHNLRGLPNPVKVALVQKLMSGIEHVHGRPRKKAAPLDLNDIKAITESLLAKDTLKAKRDRALILLMYFAVMRRSEVSALNMEHIEFLPEGLVVLFPKSKTDQKGEGETCAIPVYPDEALCPVRALITWRQASGIYEGAVFVPITKYDTIHSGAHGRLSPDRIDIIIKSLAKAVGLTQADKISSHSCRRGFTTSSARKGTPLHVLQRHGRWKHPKTVIGYIEAGRQFEDNAAKALFE